MNDVVFYVHYGDIHTTWNHFLDFKWKGLIHRFNCGDSQTTGI